MDFPSGFNIAAWTTLENAGIGDGGIVASGQTLTYTVTNPVNIPAQTKIRIEVGNILNAAATGASFQVTITTKDSNGNTIDGPTATTAFAIKQIGNGDIADNAITSSKIANNVVTTAKLSQDAVHVVWYDNTPGNLDILYRANAGDVFDHTAVDLSSNAAGDSYVPSIAVSGNNVYVVWEDSIPGNPEIFYRSTDGGATFGSTVNLSNNAGSSEGPAIAVSGNNVYVVWQDDTPGGIQILLRRSIDAGATFGSTVSLILRNNGELSERPDIAVSPNNF